LFPPDLKQFIHAYSDLFWSIPENKKDQISEAVLVEYILNYGSLDDCRELFSLMGVKKAAEVFRGAKGRQKLNYYPEIYNFFSLYFDQYAQ